LSVTRRETQASSNWANKELTSTDRADLAFRYLDWLLTKKVPSGGFRLLYVILQCFNKENPFEAFPSIEYISQRIDRRPSSVWEMLPKLEKIGSIEIEWGSRGSGHPNVYRLPAEFLEFYFGPEKGRRKQFKKPRPTGVSKPRRTGVSGSLETPVQPLENTCLPPLKPRPAGVNHLEPPQTTKERAYGPRSADADKESNQSTTVDAPPSPPLITTDDASISEPLRPIPAAIAAHRTVGELEPACQATSENMGSAAKAGDDAWRRRSFATIKSSYPQDHVGNQARAFAAFETALNAGHHMALIAQNVEDLVFASSHFGGDLPYLDEYLLRERWSKAPKTRVVRALIGRDR
jgi:hypothetical protein